MSGSCARPVSSVTFLALLFCAIVPGCGPRGGPSDFEIAQKKKDDTASAIRELGGEVTAVQHPGLGDGWAVKLRGMQINDDVFAQLKGLKRVAELDLSKSTITDDQLARLNEHEVGVMIVKLDLSHTAVTDAGIDTLKLGLLSYLKLTGTKVSDAAAHRLKKHRASDPRLPPLAVVR